MIVVSQSGETSDTLAALKEAKRLGAKSLAVTNVVGSSIAREAAQVLYTWAGPEIAVASTKAYTTQLILMFMLAVYMADLKGTLAKERSEALIEGLTKIPAQISETLSDVEPIKTFAKQYGFNEKTLSNIKEVKARDAVVIGIAAEGDTELEKYVDHVIHVPETDELLIPLLTVVPLQLLAYFAAITRGCDVDKPRNLAKSVTVE